MRLPGARHTAAAATFWTAPRVPTWEAHSTRWSSTSTSSTTRRAATAASGSARSLPLRTRSGSRCRRVSASARSQDAAARRQAFVCKKRCPEHPHPGRDLRHTFRHYVTSAVHQRNDGVGGRLGGLDELSIDCQVLPVGLRQEDHSKVIVRLGPRQQRQVPNRSGLSSRQLLRLQCKAQTKTDEYQAGPRGPCAAECVFRHPPGDRPGRGQQYR